MTSLRQLQLESQGDLSYILSTQTGLTSLRVHVFSSAIQYCTKLLELEIPLPLLTDYRYIPSSLTSLQLCLRQGYFDDINVVKLMNHLPHLSVLELQIGSPKFLKSGALSSLSRWSSLTNLMISLHTGVGEFSLNGLVHHGSYLVTISLDIR
jgi:hypothetical protein